MQVTVDTPIKQLYQHECVCFIYFADILHLYRHVLKTIQS